MTTTNNNSTNQVGKTNTMTNKFFDNGYSFKENRNVKLHLDISFCDNGKIYLDYFLLINGNAVIVAKDDFYSIVKSNRMKIERKVKNEFNPNKITIEFR